VTASRAAASRALHASNDSHHPLAPSSGVAAVRAGMSCGDERTSVFVVGTHLGRRRRRPS